MKKVIQFIFNHKTYCENQARIRKENELDAKVSKFLSKLTNCNTFNDLLSLHKEIVKEGFNFNTLESWNFGSKMIEDVQINDLVFFAYDRDSCIHGKDLLELENNPTDPSDWLNWSYWTSWRWYYRSLYVHIKYHRDLKPDIEIVIKYPSAIKNYFK